MLKIQNLSVNFGDKELLKDINLNITQGARHLLTGHNGSGKSTLVKTIAGDPEYTITHGQIIFNNTDITNENATTRALMGIFLGAQHAPEIPGLSVLSFLKHSCIAHTHFQSGQDLSMGEFLQKLELAREQLNIPKEWLNRSINVGFSGGERKRLMLLQLILTKPKFAILDEPDSGADTQTQQLIADTIKGMTDTTFLIISHQPAFTKMLEITDTTSLSNGKNVIE
ncbi:MAG: ATP-binding cassette domain-containing protein [Alphaproteobacteria bacterium]|nr:ATP-binding cassette domain-containing protein [Alphaproteobacteria bacterium]